MSNTSQPKFTAISMFQAQFGSPPGSQDAKNECEKWERLCNELLADRERLRAELERVRLDKICKDFKPVFTREEIYAQVDCETTIDQLITELESWAEKKP